MTGCEQGNIGPCEGAQGRIPLRLRQRRARWAFVWLSVSCAFTTGCDRAAERDANVTSQQTSPSTSAATVPVRTVESAADRAGPSRALVRFVDNLARGAVGCTTTIEFERAGTFYLYQETLPGGSAPVAGCAPQPDPNRSFDVVLTGPHGPVTLTADDTVSYTASGHKGRSIASFEIVEPGLYEIAVVGPTVDVGVAIGKRAPDS